MIRGLATGLSQCPGQKRSRKTTRRSCGLPQMFSAFSKCLRASPKVAEPRLSQSRRRPRGLRSGFATFMVGRYLLAPSPRLASGQHAEENDWEVPSATTCSTPTSGRTSTRTSRPARPGPGGLVSPGRPLESAPELPPSHGHYRAKGANRDALGLRGHVWNVQAEGWSLVSPRAAQ